VQIDTEHNTVWLSQKQMAELFQTSVPNINTHITNVFKEGELDRNSVIKEYLTTAADGKNYKTKYYDLDVIISVGCRVRSLRGIENIASWKGTRSRIRSFEKMTCPKICSSSGHGSAGAVNADACFR
jgi:hypothetical protein